MKNIVYQLDDKAVCYFDQILEATSLKTVAIQPPTSYITNNSNMMNNIWLKISEK